MRLFTQKDMADHFGVTKQYINKLKANDPNFPDPIDRKGRVELYTEEQVNAYAASRDFDNPHTNRLERVKREEGEEEATDEGSEADSHQGV